MIPNPFSGRFIALEGIDGCGKGEQVRRSARWLIEQKITLICTKEPNENGPWGSQIYKDLANPNGLNKTDPFRFQMWYACDSKQNLREVVIPRIRAGCNIVTDRFRPSMVYGAKTVQEIAKLMAMNQFILGEDFIWPDATLIFDVSVETAIRRSREKNRDLDEHERAEVLMRVRLNYLHFSSTYPAGCHVINGGRPPEEVFEEVKFVIAPMFKLKI